MSKFVLEGTYMGQSVNIDTTLAQLEAMAMNISELQSRGGEAAITERH